MDVSEALLALINEKDVSYGELSRRTGIPKSAIQRYATGQTNKIPIDRVEKIVNALSGSVLDVMGWSEVDEPEEIITFPVIGNIAAGYDGQAVEDYTGDEIAIPSSWLRKRPKTDYFMLKVKGDSMYPMYQDGDIILVKRQATLDHSGQIGVVIYEDTNATLKKVEYVYGEDWMKLIPINPAFPPIMVKDEALEHCRVLGYPIKLIRDIR